MIVYRICKTYPPDYNPIDGKGAAKYGGRWNSIGRPAVYTAESLSLARSELTRHLNLETVPDKYSVYEIEIPDLNYLEVRIGSDHISAPLPIDWDTDPESPTSKELGDNYLADPTVLAIKLPSVCDPKSFNYLLNPKSNLFHMVKVVKEYQFVP